MVGDSCSFMFAIVDDNIAVLCLLCSTIIVDVAFAVFDNNGAVSRFLWLGCNSAV